MRTIRDHTRAIGALLRKAGVESPGLCARVICAHVAGLDEIAFLLAQDLPIPNEARLYCLAGRLAAGEPLAHVLGFREFYGRNFRVSPDVLIPRPETELLVDLALELLPGKKLDFADLGCGSGCIGISLALERPHWQGILLDKSARALAIARKNLGDHSARASLVAGDIFDLPLLPASLDLVLANPPYIGPDDEVMPCVREYEPPCALYSSAGGLAHLAAVARAAIKILRSPGLLLLEHGAGQGKAVLDLLAKAGFSGNQCRQDLAGLDRCALGWKI